MRLLCKMGIHSWGYGQRGNHYYKYCKCCPAYKIILQMTKINDTKRTWNEMRIYNNHRQSVQSAKERNTLKKLKKLFK